MNLKQYIFLLWCCILCNIRFALGQELSEQSLKYINQYGTTISSRFSTTAAGENYYRKQALNGSFEHYLLNLPLKSVGAKTHLATGLEKKFNVQIGVVDLKRITDKQQSAQIIMRLRAEYLYSSRLYGRIHFNFTNGFVFSYAKWAAGFRINDTKNGWIQSTEQDYSKTTFKNYLDVLYTNTTLASLSREMTKIPITDIKAGDVFIQNGQPGHAVIVIDVLRNDEDKMLKIMLAQGNTPAQELEILRNDIDGSPWFTLSYDSSESTKIMTPEWTFYVKDLKCFTN